MAFAIPVGEIIFSRLCTPPSAVSGPRQCGRVRRRSSRHFSPVSRRAPPRPHGPWPILHVIEAVEDEEGTAGALAAGGHNESVSCLCLTCSAGCKPSRKAVPGDSRRKQHAGVRKSPDTARRWSSLRGRKLADDPPMDQVLGGMRAEVDFEPMPGANSPV